MHPIFPGPFTHACSGRLQTISRWAIRGGCGVWIGLALGACSKDEAKSPPAPISAAPTASPAAPPTPTVTPAVPNTVRAAFGRWRREDGGYVLEIRDATPQGSLEAQYFNPKPIRVSRAAWREGAGRAQLLVELNDVGYAGSTYILFHDPTTDRLVGEYTQPTQQQTYAIEFVRSKGP